MDNQIEVTGIIGMARYRTEISADGHLLLSDESIAVGGANEGPAPAAFMAASLASCTAITLRMYADRKGWNLTQADVKVMITREKGQNMTRINRSIKLHGMLSDEEKKRLLEIANKCPVHQMLTNPIEVVSALES